MESAQANELAAQARSVAESILASPKVGPMGPGALAEATQMMQNLNLKKNAEQHHREHEQCIDEDDDDEDGPNMNGLANLFVGDLARNATEEEIEKIFSRYGEVLNVDIKRDKVTHNNLGYGFVQFRTREQAMEAKDHLNGIEICNRKVRLGWAQKNTTLFIGDLDGTVSTAQLREIFRKFGEIVEEETFVKAGSGKYGFVRYKLRQDAERAKTEMNRQLIGSRSVRIGWGDNSIQKHCVHVQFDPFAGGHLEEDKLIEHFRSYGPVSSVSLPRHATGRLKGYGFVHFEDGDEGENAAGKAINDLSNGSTIAGLVVKCSYGKRMGFNRNRPGGGKPPGPPKSGRSNQQMMMYGYPVIVPQYVGYPGQADPAGAAATAAPAGRGQQPVAFAFANGYMPQGAQYPNPQYYGQQVYFQQGGANYVLAYPHTAQGQQRTGSPTSSEGNSPTPPQGGYMPRGMPSPLYMGMPGPTTPETIHLPSPYQPSPMSPVPLAPVTDYGYYPHMMPPQGGYVPMEGPKSGSDSEK